MINTKGKLWIFNLNVGQADSAAIVTPRGNVLIVDAANDWKLTDLLGNLGLKSGERIAHLVITHPHHDHYAGVSGLLNTYTIGCVTLSPSWNHPGKRGYHDIFNQILSKKIPFIFLSGYSRCYPDAKRLADTHGVQVELLGPSNYLVESFTGLADYNPNYLSVITRLRWGKFAMILAADAQMENWAYFDHEGLLEGGCTILKAAHHGSANGTQFERINRLGPKFVIVSSDPEGRDALPDLVGCAVFLRYAESGKRKPIVALSDAVGTTKAEVDQTGQVIFTHYGESKDARVPLSQPRRLSLRSKHTDWKELVRRRL